MPKTLVQVAASQVGVTESWGANWGPQVKVYQSVTGAYRAAWCVSFLQWCLKQIGIGPIANRTAGVWYLWNYAKAKGWVVHSSAVEPGDLVIMPGFGGSGHIGMVEHAQRPIFQTIEGNHDNMVKRETRYLSQITGFVRVPGSHVPKPAPKKRHLPKFEVVGSDRHGPKIILRGTLPKVQANLPAILHNWGKVVVRWQATRAAKKGK